MFQRIEMMLAYMLAKKRENVSEDEKWWKSLTGQKFLKFYSQSDESMDRPESTNSKKYI